MTTNYFFVDGWESLSDAEAIEAAVDRHGEDETTSVAYCALETWGDHNNLEYEFWFGLFLKLKQREHIGWA